MPDLFSPFTLKDITLRNRIAMSPMTMYRSENGLMNDFHIMLLGSRAAGGFGLVFPEQLAILPTVEPERAVPVSTMITRSRVCPA